MCMCDVAGEDGHRERMSGREKERKIETCNKDGR